jgi:type VI secretion system protein ImpF
VVRLPDERLKPSLLERLTDDAPLDAVEGLRERFATARTLRDSVVRDLGWLLNSVRLSSTQDLAAFPLAAKSVLNFGMPDLAGRTLSSIDVSSLEAELKQAIIDFEPRLLPDSVQVTVQSKNAVARGAHTEQDETANSMQFIVQALLQAYPSPLGLWLRTEIDLETGDVSIADVGQAGALRNPG